MNSLELPLAALVVKKTKWSEVTYEDVLAIN